ncbi:MAG: aromatic ring-hydroxylating dioxygenase subunit alpha [Phycisphaeraceae bacterium]|nr:aromatic ring-hydroxylating dioxygenase subunit alpha [Phycisphaeraceae bacterium]
MSRQLPDVHPDITLAQTLPGWIYGDPELHARILSTVFRRSWQPISDLDALRVPGTALPVTLLEGSLDEPLLITRDHDDRLHVLSNACTHRGNLVAEHGAVCSTLRCRYHGRRFDLDGRFKHMPEFEGCKDFPSERDNLPRVPFADFAKLIWCSLDPICTFDEAIAPIRQRLSFIDTASLTLEPTRCRDYLVNANWALYCDNYLEGLHIPFVHDSLNDALDYGAYETDLHRWCNLQIGTAAKNSADPCFETPAEHPDHGKRIAAYYYWLFPNIMLNFYPWGLSVNIVRPLSPTLTKVSFLTYIGDRSKMDRGAGSGLDRVEREDEAVVEATQKGVRSTLYTRGRYSPSREQCVHHFHRLLLESLIA